MTVQSTLNDFVVNEGEEDTTPLKKIQSDVNCILLMLEDLHAYAMQIILCITVKERQV